MLEVVTNDLFNIAKRIKSINPRYVVFREPATGRVEVHSSACDCRRACNIAKRPCSRSLRGPSNLTLEFIVPYDCLDERTLEYARKTRIENFDELEHQNEETNSDIQLSAKRSTEKSAQAVADMMKYAGGQIHNVVFKKAKRWF